MEIPAKLSAIAGWEDVSTTHAEQIAHTATVEGPVLLENENTMPLKKNDTVALIGPYANVRDRRISAAPEPDDFDPYDIYIDDNRAGSVETTIEEDDEVLVHLGPSRVLPTREQSPAEPTRCGNRIID
ncbi:exo-1 [Aspergillus affinis]|uniref:exo-1 n=1 Tax=Aspergillus affinis TaxID=1070780 RepID=UPI0022FEDBFA|nr:exo-1 [Aspergillus affinis]KAI9044116.1 exo-1 [Aspergillus affinis]